MRPRRSFFAVAGGLLVAVTFLATARSAWAQAPQYYDGEVYEPAIRVWFDPSMNETSVVAVGESWRDDAEGNVRLEAAFSYKGRTPPPPPRTVYLSLVRVAADEAWKKSTRFKILADGSPVGVTFSRRESAYESRGVKLGMEETLFGQITSADLRRLSKARRAVVKIGKESFDISQQTQAKLAELIDQPHAAPAAP